MFIFSIILSFKPYAVPDEKPCENFNKTCEYTCDPTEQKCLCPIGYQLAEDGQSCIGNNLYNTCKRLLLTMYVIFNFLFSFNIIKYKCKY